MLMRFSRFVAHFRNARGGLAATEFALIAPVMLAIYFGVTELCDGLTANMKVTGVASAAGDLYAQKIIAGRPYKAKTDLTRKKISECRIGTL